MPFHDNVNPQPSNEQQSSECVRTESPAQLSSTHTIEWLWSVASAESTATHEDSGIMRGTIDQIVDPFREDWQQW